MIRFKHFLSWLTLAAALTGTCGQAAATPLYHVDIDTASLGTGSAFLELYFLGLDGAPAATAIVSSLTGALDGAADLTGTVTGTAPGTFVLGNAGGGGDLVQGIQLGGKFGFDVSFTMLPGDIGTTFGWALFDTTHYLGADGDLGNLFLQPFAPVGEQILVAAPSTRVSSLTKIPEPSTAALMLVAVLAMGAWRRQGVRRF
ncbi:PEP-CTERM sorting domain-containing protein [Massilia sp. NEAU-DD11]|uniref:PEP-CTERM sorting domain-containing protein n=1 Tax=Massilia cellulosiltytica TaxID=2683234 RepID=A0A7X3FX40_9BURK|nr:NF038129 family PEP-CTERM protein [Telluria cellulosilytica]MVW59646.1 PEP-CTERM sorting domain-containing protein [Telluria cellulosilytica]